LITPAAILPNRPLRLAAGTVVSLAVAALVVALFVAIAGAAAGTCCA
jgi:hypothetical protein